VAAGFFAAFLVVVDEEFCAADVSASAAKTNAKNATRIANPPHFGVLLIDIASRTIFVPQAAWRIAVLLSDC
jgi:hypothetical protein